MSPKQWAMAGILALAALAAVPRPAAADQKGAFGLGLIIGEPTGISGKLYLSNDTAVDAAVGGAVVGRGVQVHADYLWHPWILTSESAFVMPAYVGIGGRLLDHNRGNGREDDIHMGARFVGGLLFDFTQVPIDVFVELALVVDFRAGADDDDHDGFGLDLNAGVGARYYF